MAIFPDIQAAVPPTGGGAVNKTLLRNAITARTPYVLSDAENPSDLVCVDPLTGSAIIDILFNGRLFHYDATDLVTPPDGTTCIVSDEGRRYKLSDGADVFAYSVLDNSLSAPPTSPTPAIGDSYLVAPAATGDWAGRSNEVTFLSARGWEFIDFGIGRLLYVESLEAYYHRKSTGEWEPGFGNLINGPNSISLSAAINFGKYAVVENQTTTSPPGSASVGTAYIIGPSATGTWAGQDGKVAICEVANTFTIYTPTNGWAAYDKSLNTALTHNGTSWISGAGSWVARASNFVVSGTTTSPSGASRYVYNSSTAPTTSSRGMIDNGATITGYAAKKAGAKLRFEYQADAVFAQSGNIGSSASTGPLCVGLFRDSVTSAIAWCKLDVSGYSIWRLLNANSLSTMPSPTEGQVGALFEIDAPDTAAHNYFVVVLSGYDSTVFAYDCTALTRRLISVQEAA